MTDKTARVIPRQVNSIATCRGQIHRGDSQGLDAKLANPLSHQGPL